MKKTLMIGAALAAVVAASPAAAADNLLTNGSFENGLTGWNVTNTGSGTGYTAPVVIAYNQASQYPTGAFGEAVPTDNAPGNPGFDAVGNNFLYLSSDVGTSTISQMVSLVAGTSYTFGFDFYLPNNGYANANNATFTASLAGTPFANFTLGSQPAATWMFNSAARTFTANESGDFALSFIGSAFPAKDVAIDRVFLAQTGAVPEPATWALMLAGFGLVGFAMRRRNKVSTTVRFA